MRKSALSLLLLFAALFFSGCGDKSAPCRDDLTLWYDAPARRWEETLPLGNGRLGIMPDGGISRERMVLNEESVWSGAEHDTSNPDALAALPEIRRLLLEGRNLEAQDLMYSRFVCGGGGSASEAYGSFQILANLDLQFDIDTSAVTHYERGLSLRDAEAYTRFRAGDADYSRNYIVSALHDVAAADLRTSRRGSLSFTLALDRPERFAVDGEGDMLSIFGTLDSGTEGREGVSYLARVRVVAEGGEVSNDGRRLTVRNADHATIYISAATSYNGDGYVARADSLLENAVKTGFGRLRRGHRREFRRLFDRVSLHLCGGRGNDIPTDRRLERFAADHDDPSLAALYMQYGRYLLISSTLRGCLPPNLQGLWANTVQTPWRGDYHLNINVEMNHWPAERGNLSELHLPLAEYTKRLAQSGAVTARRFYDAEGWCAHVLANAWNFSAPSENPSWGATNTGGAWLALHLWQHYLYTLDDEYLADVWPTLRGAADFFRSILVEEPTHGWLVTAPTSSPENGFYDESDSRITYICCGSTMDNQIVRELFESAAAAADILHIGDGCAAEFRALAERLPPDRISEEGYLLEWLKDYRESEPQHRHVSHLFGLYPGRSISRRLSPELAEACRATLERRGDEGTGWSRAWKVCFWARLGDGERAFKLLCNLLHPAFDSDGGQHGGTYPNLLCSHPPFQIDGNFGGSAGIMEMLLQSDGGDIELLPALPASWADGEFRGLVAERGIEVSCRWRGGRVGRCSLLSPRDTDCTVLFPDGGRKVVHLRAGRRKTLRP